MSGHPRPLTAASLGVLCAAVGLSACGTTPSAVMRRSAASTTVQRSAALASPVPRPVTLPTADGDAAVTAAVGYELAHCAWDWRTPFAAHVAAETALATPGYARTLRRQADPVTWRSEVIAQRQSVTCTVLDAALMPDAPNDATTSYVRLMVRMHVSSTRGSFDTGELTASCLMRLVNNRWLIDGPFEGG